jgi:beta-glucanase (GH16 family)
MCKGLVRYEDFSSGVYNETFKLLACKDGVTVGPSSADPSKNSLKLLLLSGCGAAKVNTMSVYGGGYFETVLRLGGQGANFTGLVYAWYLRECEGPNCTAPNEIDFEWLGKPSKEGLTQTNWYYNGVDRNEAFSSAPPYPYNGFVKYAIYWDDDYFAWYINDIQVRKVLYTASLISPLRPQKLYISVWDGKPFPTWAGAVNWSLPETVLQNYFMELQYVTICTV